MNVYRTLRNGAGIGLLAALIVITPLHAQSVGSGGIGGRPAFPREDNPRTQSIFVHTIEPGTSVNDGVIVVNNSDQTKDVLVYATDSVVASGGALTCAQKVDESSDVGSWVELEQTEVTLDPAATVTIPFTITVPEGTTVGEHNGCIVIEEAAGGENSTDQGIALNFRNALRIAILVPGEITKDLEIVSLSASSSGSTTTLTPRIQNKGNVSIDTDIQTKILYAWGTTYSRQGGIYPVLKEQTGEWNIAHDRPFFGGWYRATVQATYDASTDSYLGDATKEFASISYPTQWFFVVPHPLALLLYAAIIATVGYIFYRRRRLTSTQQSWKNYVVEDGDTVKKLARAHGVSWQKVVKINRLKAPYDLEPGQKIKLPAVEDED